MSISIKKEICKKCGELFIPGESVALGAVERDTGKQTGIKVLGVMGHVGLFSESARKMSISGEYCKHCIVWNDMKQFGESIAIKEIAKFKKIKWNKRTEKWKKKKKK